jgi:Tfp pilus assembly protein PilZ
MDYTELRKHPRVNVDFFADWGWGPECEHYDKITSLSLSGCFLATRRELSRGDEIYLRLSAESTGAINLKGAVRYQLRVREDTPPTGAGVEFVGLSDEAQTKLQKVMNSYLQSTS